MRHVKLERWCYAKAQMLILQFFPYKDNLIYSWNILAVRVYSKTAIKVTCPKLQQIEWWHLVFPFRNAIKTMWHLSSLISLPWWSDYPGYKIQFKGLTHCFWYPVSKIIKPLLFSETNASLELPCPSTLLVDSSGENILMTMLEYTGAKIKEVLGSANKCEKVAHPEAIQDSRKHWIISYLYLVNMWLGNKSHGHTFRLYIHMQQNGKEM